MSSDNNTQIVLPDSPNTTLDAMFDQTHILYQQLGERLENLREIQSTSNVGFEAFKELAKELAEALQNQTPLPRDHATTALARIAREITGADIAFCRTVGTQAILEKCSAIVAKPGFFLTKEGRASNYTEFGLVPVKKHRDDCGCSLEEIWAQERQEYLNGRAERRTLPNGEKLYNDEELTHLKWLRSEATVPLAITGKQDDPKIAKAVIVLSSADPKQLNQETIKLLEPYKPFFDALFTLADMTEDRIEKSRLAQLISKALPRIAMAQSEEAFQRAIVTLLTCQDGFEYDRAMLFRFPNGGYPAVCQMAVGGIHPAEHFKKLAQIEVAFDGDFLAYIDNALQYPEPGTGRSQVRDDLYDKYCKPPVEGQPPSKLLYDEGDSPTIEAVLDGSWEGDPLPKLTSADPWIKKMQEEHGDVFNSPHDEYWVIPLKHFELKNEDSDTGKSKPTYDDTKLGFIIVDLCQQPRPHAPGTGAPDLYMTGLVLNLISEIWMLRERTDTYFHILNVIPTLRHGTIHLTEIFQLLRRPLLMLERVIQEHQLSASVRRRLVDEVQTPLLRRYEELDETTAEFEEAKAVLEGIRREENPDNYPANIEETVLEIIGEAQSRENHAFTLEKGCIEYAEGVRLPYRLCKSILHCLLENTVRHGKRGTDPVKVTFHIKKIALPQGPKNGERVLIIVENNGQHIPPEFAPFLFVDQISTNSSTHGHGTGLSTARLQAKAYGGDVVLLNAGNAQGDNVQFGIVLELFSPTEASTMEEETGASNE